MEIIDKQKKFDVNIYNNIKITDLCIENCGFDSLPDGISKLTKLQNLTIKNTPLRTLPADIHLLPELRSLTIEGTKMKQLPPTLAQCGKLIKIYIPKNKFKALPDFLPQMERLYYLDISGNPLEGFPHILFNLPVLSYCKCRGMSIFHSKFRDFHRNNRFFLSIQNDKYDADIKYAMYLLLSGDAELCKNISFAHLLDATVCRNTEIKSMAQILLSEEAKKHLINVPLDKNSVIAVLGKTSESKDYLTNQLEPLGVTIATRVSHKCTHLLVGNQLTPEQRQQLLHWKKPFLFAKQLNDFLESKETFFLALPAAKTEESEAQTANLSALLTSQDEASIQLALEIMRVNGVPKSLISIIFIIAKTGSINSDIRKQAVQLLEKNASTGLYMKAKSTKMINLGSFRFNAKNIRFFLTDTELDWRVLYDYAQRHYSNVFCYEHWFPFMSEAEMKATYLGLLDKGDFVLQVNLVSSVILKQLFQWRMP
jgi:hypothetical protein